MLLSVETVEMSLKLDPVDSRRVRRHREGGVGSIDVGEIFRGRDGDGGLIALEELLLIVGVVERMEGRRSSRVRRS